MYSFIPPFHTYIHAPTYIHSYRGAGSAAYLQDVADFATMQGCAHFARRFEPMLRVVFERCSHVRQFVLVKRLLKLRTKCLVQWADQRVRGRKHVTAVTSVLSFKRSLERSSMGFEPVVDT